jgi:tripartite ATP-independent transporter DctM subunit
MTPEAAGIFFTCLMILLFVLGMPVGFAMMLSGLLGFSFLNGMESTLTLLAYDIVDIFSSYTLSVIPMFILMGSFAYASGISSRLYRANHAWFGAYRGGLTIATVLACAGFAAICGSTAATAATMGRIALPEMKRYGYDDQLAAGTVASAGTLGILIPPSTIFIIYGILTEQSIGSLFVSGILPGLLLTFAYVVTVVFLCKRNPEMAPPGEPTTWAQKFRSLSGIAETILLFGITIGGLLFGWFSPTQAGAIGAAGALVIGLARRQLTLASFRDSCTEALRISVMVLFIIAGATVYGHFMVISHLPFTMADWVGSLAVPRIVMVLLIVALYFIGGFFMDSMALVVVTIPIFFPLVQKLGFDPIWFGVIIVLVAEMGVITPPVGVNVFVIQGIAPDIPLETIFKGIFPFLLALILVTMLVVLFPEIATFLPNLTKG